MLKSCPSCAELFAMISIIHVECLNEGYLSLISYSVLGVDVVLLVMILQSTRYDRWNHIVHYVEHTPTDSHAVTIFF